MNLSTFPATIEEVGFTLLGERAKLGKRLLVHPFLPDGGSWPRKLGARESLTVYSKTESLPAGALIGKAYARTACDTYGFGSSPALEQLKAEVLRFS